MTVWIRGRNPEEPGLYMVKTSRDGQPRLVAHDGRSWASRDLSGFIVYYRPASPSECLESSAKG